MAFQESMPPAAAYPIVAGMLPKAYFLAHPPAKGMRMSVKGSDGVATSWDVDEETAARLTSRLTGRGLAVSAVPYEEAPRAA